MTTKEIKILNLHLGKIYTLNRMSTAEMLSSEYDRMIKTHKIQNEIMTIAVELEQVWKDRDDGNKLDKDDGNKLDRFELMDL